MLSCDRIALGKIIAHIAPGMSAAASCCAVLLAVLTGMDVVKKIEALGSPSGKPSKVITITDSGQLPGRTEI